jgi:hypothetical protein
MSEGIMEEEMLAHADTWNLRRDTAAAQSCDLSLLPLFPSASDLPEDPDEIVRVLGSPVVQEVRCFVLGPEGTNIAQACARWLERVGLQAKSTAHLCDTPEDSVDAARRETAPERGILGIFWICAVFDREKEVFFKNPDAYPFFVQETMLLDEVQLATRPAGAGLRAQPLHSGALAYRLPPLACTAGRSAALHSDSGPQQCRRSGELRQRRM